MEISGERMCEYSNNSKIINMQNMCEHEEGEALAWLEQISGSPRKEGNTEILVKQSLKPFYEKGWEVTEFFLSNKIINPCKGCETCNDTGECVIEGDDMESLAFSVNHVISKAIPEATKRISALIENGFLKLEDNTILPYGDYYIR